MTKLLENYTKKGKALVLFPRLNRMSPCPDEELDIH